MFKVQNNLLANCIQRLLKQKSQYRVRNDKKTSENLINLINILFMYRLLENEKEKQFFRLILYLFGQQKFVVAVL